MSIQDISATKSVVHMVAYIRFSLNSSKSSFNRSLHTKLTIILTFLPIILFTAMLCWLYITDYVLVITGFMMTFPHVQMPYLPRDVLLVNQCAIQSSTSLRPSRIISLINRSF